MKDFFQNIWSYFASASGPMRILCQFDITHIRLKYLRTELQI
jgi:hypothetical protein